MSTPISGSGSSSSSTGSSPSIDQAATQAAIQQLLQSGSQPAVSFGGLVSGINTSQIVQALMAADEAPILQLQSQEASEQSKLAHWQDYNSKLTAIQTAAQTLGLQSTINAKTVTFSGGVATGVVLPTANLGTFSLQIDNLATATTVTSSNAIVGSDDATSSGKLSTPVTTGTFSIDGASITVNSGDTFDTILANIKIATGNIVSGQIVNNKIVLTSSDSSAITIGGGGDTSNFLSVTNLTGQGGSSTATSSAAIGTGSSGIGVAISGNDVASVTSKLPTKVTAGTFTVDGATVTVNAGDTFNTILASIATATGGAVTGTVAANGIHLTSSSAIFLGSGGDTSNFLTVVKLLGQPASTTMNSSGPVGMANESLDLNDASISGLASETTGSFSINNVNITYNTSTDTLDDVLSRINASSAGVTATYDPNADRVILTATNTGNLDITVSDGSGNLMSRLGLTSTAAHSIGQSAKYEVNGGPAQYSLSNTVKNLVPGVNVTLMSPTSTGSPSTANVQQDPSVGTKAIQDFVTAYNALVDEIKTDTAYDTTTKIGGIFLGDSTVSTIQQDLDSGLFISNGAKLGLAPPYIDVSTIGLSTGPVGSSPGTTTDVQFDSSTFQAALASNPQAVTNLVNTVFNNLAKTVNDLIQPFGVVDTVIRGENTQISDLQSQIADQQLFLQQQQQLLQNEFTSLDTELADLQSQSSAGAAVLSSLGSNAASTSASSAAATQAAATGTSGA